MLANCGINYCCVYSPSNGQNWLNHRVAFSWGSILKKIDLRILLLPKPTILHGNMLLFHTTSSDIVLTKVYNNIHLQIYALEFCCREKYTGPIGRILKNIHWSPCLDSSHNH